MDKEKLKTLARKVCNTTYLILFQKKYEKKISNKIEECRKEDKKSTYYIISCEHMPMQGLFGYVSLVLPMVRYALQHSFIPIVDMKNYANSYLEEGEIGKINAWDLFFQPLAQKKLDQVYEEGNYIIGNHYTDIDWNDRPNLRGYYWSRTYSIWKELYRKYIVLSEEAREYCTKEYQELLCGREQETLGVLIRGTDIKKCKGHAIQPTVQQTAELIRKVLRQHKQYKYIYLATEEQANETYLKKEFPSKIIVNARTYYDDTDYSRGLSYVHMEGEHDRYHRGLQYLSSIMLLSKCGGLISGQCEGGYAAFYLNGGKYQYCFFWELGNIQ